ncbi:Uncharacterised protein [uncultured archaeon]|nr:Uncharacterised protein [uncultured archaeon]
MPTIVHFDVAAENPERAKKFYEKIFGWKIIRPPGPIEYYLIETKGLKGEDGVAGGLGKRGAPNQKITNYFGVESVEKYAQLVEEAHGKVLQRKMIVPGWGYLTTCEDTEGNVFGLWEEDSNAR